MNKFLESAWPYLRNHTPRNSSKLHSIRHVSTLSAIKRGLRASQPNRRSDFRIKKRESEWTSGRTPRSGLPIRPRERTSDNEPEFSVLPKENNSNDGHSHSQENPRSSMRKELAWRYSREVTISKLLGRVKEPLLDLQKVRQESKEGRVDYPESTITQVRTLLGEINQDYRSGFLTTKGIQRALKLVLPDQLWSRSEGGGNYPRLHFNRPETKLALLYDEGVVDTHVDKVRNGTSSTVKTTRVGSKDRVISRDGDRRSPASSLPEERRRNRHHIEQDNHDDAAIDDSALAVPYSTAASVFLYGYNTVYAALKAGRRRFYRLHLASTNDPFIQEIRTLASKAGINDRQGTSVALLNKMSEYRPHNGAVLEASRLPAIPTLGLRKPRHDTGAIPLDVDTTDLDYRSASEQPTLLPPSLHPTRQPLIVMLDGITDPGNVGSILRTCFFYGVDAVAIATATCANINSATLAKASSGACEAIPILTLPKPSNFVYSCAHNGWEVLAAVAPGAKSAGPGKKYLNTSQLASASPLANKPCVLMLGAEGEGLRSNLLNHADTLVTIENGRSRDDKIDVGVESLNVSIAASVLLESLLRPVFVNQQKSVGKGSLGFGSN